MKTIIKVAALICQVIVCKNVYAQNEEAKIDTSLPHNSIFIANADPFMSYHNFNTLDFEQEVFLLEAGEMKEAYSNLLAKVEKLKYEKKLYQKAIQDNTIIRSEKSFTCHNVPDSPVRCGDAFMEPIVPFYENEQAVITYFIPDVYESAKLYMSDSEGKSVLEYRILSSGYGQYIISAWTLGYGSYKYCLVVNNRKMDCMKLIVMK